MHVMILGAAGMIGRKLVDRLAAAPSLADRQVTRLTLADVTMPPGAGAFSGEVNRMKFDISDPADVTGIVAQRPDIIIHLAAIVSSEAEAEFEKGYAINLDGTRRMFEAIRSENAASGYCPRVVFTSSIAVYGAPLPELIEDTHIRAPLTSYGTQKAIGELLLDDYSRRGFLDGVGIRLPTICVRPGKPNQAASGFFSSILREPLAGQQAVLPVPDTVRHWFASPRAAVDFILHAAAMDSSALGTRRSLTMPGVIASVAEQIAALEEIAGAEAVALIHREPDEQIAAIIESWPQGFRAERAEALGFRAEASFNEIIRVHLRDEMGEVPA